jgi:uridylate kinase
VFATEGDVAVGAAAEDLGADVVVTGVEDVDAVCSTDPDADSPEPPDTVE